MDNLINNICVHIPVTELENTWGLWVSRVGCGGRGPGPNLGLGKKGRTLCEFAMVYLTRGKGWFYSSPDEYTEIFAGDVMLLFPGVWHSYRPHEETGWNEYWILFGGKWAESVRDAQLIRPENPILRSGVDSMLHNLFIHMIDLASSRATGYCQELSGLCMQILARALALTRTRHERRHKHSGVIAQATVYLQENLDRTPDFEKLAASLYLSYPHFRRLFRQLTGCSPHQYHLQLRIMRAKELLERENLLVKEVACALGFEDTFYFARIFKQKTGVAPSEWQRM